MDAYRLFPGMVSQSALLQTQQAAKKTLVSSLNGMQFLGSSEEGFMTSIPNVLNAITATAIVPTSGINVGLSIFDTGRGVGNTTTPEVTAIPSQVQALQSFYDLYNLYTTGSTQNIFATVKTTLDAAVASFALYNELRTDTFAPPVGGYFTDLSGVTDLSGQLGRLVNTWNANNLTNATLISHIRANAVTEAMPIQLYVNTYVEARKFISDTDMSGSGFTSEQTLAAVKSAFGYLTFSAAGVSLKNEYAGPLTSPAPLSLTGTPGTTTLATVRNNCKQAMVTIVNALNSMYPWPTGQAAPAALTTTTSVADISGARRTILGLWSALLSQRIQDISGMIGNPASLMSTGTYQSIRNAADSGCISPYSDIGDGGCWSDKGINLKKWDADMHESFRETDGLIKYNYGLFKSYSTKLLFTSVPPPAASITNNGTNIITFKESGNEYTIKRSCSESVNMSLLFTTGSSTKTTTNSIGISNNCKININLPSLNKQPISDFRFSATASGVATGFKYKVAYGDDELTNFVLVDNIDLTTSDPNNINNIISFLQPFPNTNIRFYSLTFIVPVSGSLRINNFNINCASAPYTYNNNKTLLSSYEIVNNVFTTFQGARAQIAATANNATFAIITRFRNAYNDLSGSILPTNANIGNINTAVTDSNPTNPADPQSSTDGQHIYNPTASSPSLTAIQSKYQTALRNLYNAVLEFMDTTIATFNRLGNRYNRFRTDTEINQLFRDFSSNIIDFAAIPTSPKDYGNLNIINSPTNVTDTDISGVRNAVAKNYAASLETLRQAVQGKLKIFLDTYDDVAAQYVVPYTRVAPSYETPNTPTANDMVTLMDSIAGVDGGPSGADVGVVGGEVDSVKTAMTRFYKDAYIPYVRYLKAADVSSSTNIQNAITKCLAYFYLANGSTKTFAALSVGDTYSSLRNVVNVGYIAFANLLISTYDATRALWSGRMTFSNAAPTPLSPITPANPPSSTDVSGALNIVTTYAAPTSLYWPKLVEEITAFTRKRIQAAQDLSNLYTSPAGSPVTLNSLTPPKTANKGMGPAL